MRGRGLNESFFVESLTGSCDNSQDAVHVLDHAPIPRIEDLRMRGLA